ncbi:hypothetical protein [Klebsiella michiganensis]|nr:hypothetical protein [Klebsiella michiganensis]QAS65866.1 hypothetical protein KOCBH_03372 [Klebsiella michiganensis]
MKKELWRGVLALAVLSLPAMAKTGVSFSHKEALLNKSDFG